MRPVLAGAERNTRSVAADDMKISKFLFVVFTRRRFNDYNIDSKPFLVI